MSTDLWGTDAVDVEAYLARIGRASGPPTLDTLTRISEAHATTIPFENVDVVLGTHRGIALDVVAAKLVDRRRGGYCYEHAGLLAAVLDRLGFGVTRLTARVQPHRGGPNTHMTLRVAPTEGHDRTAQLVDVGFGAGMLTPMPLRDGTVVDQAGWKHRLDHADGVWTLSRATGEGWAVQHSFDETPQLPIDYEVFHHYTATHPRSPFTGQLVVMRIAPGVLRTLVGDELTTEHADGTRTTRHVPPEQAPEVLAELGVELDDAERSALVHTLQPNEDSTVHHTTQNPT